MTGILQDRILPQAMKIKQTNSASENRDTICNRTKTEVAA